MKYVYIVWDIIHDEENHQRYKVINEVYDSEKKAIRCIQRHVKRVHKICEKQDGPKKDHITYLIDHVPIEEEIRGGKDVHYQTIDGCKRIFAYGIYCVN